MTFEWEPPPNLETLLAALRIMKQIPVEVAEGENWPEEGALLWVPGISARGVHLRSEDGVLTVRIPALGSLGDFRFACVLAESFAKGDVDIEDTKSYAPGEIRAAIDEWYVRESAAAIEALRMTLGQGNTATIEGPKYTLTLGPDTELDLMSASDVLREAHAEESSDGGKVRKPKKARPSAGARRPRRR